MYTILYGSAREILHLHPSRNHPCRFCLRWRDALVLRFDDWPEVLCGEAGTADQGAVDIGYGH